MEAFGPGRPDEPGRSARSIAERPAAAMGTRPAGALDLYRIGRHVCLCAAPAAYPERSQTIHSDPRAATTVHAWRGLEVRLHLGATARMAQHGDQLRHRPAARA